MDLMSDEDYVMKRSTVKRIQLRAAKYNRSYRNEEAEKADADIIADDDDVIKRSTSKREKLREKYTRSRQPREESPSGQSLDSLDESSPPLSSSQPGKIYIKQENFNLKKPPTPHNDFFCDFPFLIFIFNLSLSSESTIANLRRDLSTEVPAKLTRCQSLGEKLRKSKIPRRPLLKAMTLAYSPNIEENAESEEKLSQNSSEGDDEGLNLLKD